MMLLLVQGPSGKHVVFLYSLCSILMVPGETPTGGSTTTSRRGQRDQLQLFILARDQWGLCLGWHTRLLHSTIVPYLHTLSYPCKWLASYQLRVCLMVHLLYVFDNFLKVKLLNHTCQHFRKEKYYTAVSAKGTPCAAGTAPRQRVLRYQKVPVESWEEPWCWNWGMLPEAPWFSWFLFSGLREAVLRYSVLSFANLLNNKQ